MEEIPNPPRPEQYTAEQWEKACRIARSLWSKEWKAPPYAGKTDPEGWRLAQCSRSASRLFAKPPVGSPLNAARALKRGEKGNLVRPVEGNLVEGGRTMRKRRHRSRKTRRRHK
jgi:hypothetical protein